MKIRNMILGTFILSMILTSYLATEAEAIPAFARRYKISCTTCHAPIPKLKPYGDEFAGNGFVIPEEEIERDYVSAGDPLLWLNRTFPVAVRFDAYGVYDRKAPIDNDLQAPWGVKLLSGGTLYKNIGYYFYFYLSERGEVAGIEDAYIHLNNVFKSELDIMIGQFQTSDPLMKRELRLTFEDYKVYVQRIGESRINLTYDRGIMLVYGIPQSGTDLFGMVVNGNGIGEADENRKFDDDTYKNVGVRVNQSVGEIASVGAYFYYGKERQLKIDTTLAQPVERAFDNKVTYIGPDVNIAFSKFEFTGQYLMRNDDNPLFKDNPEDIKTQGLIAELIYAPKLDKSRHYFTILYNWIDSDLDEFDYETASLSATYLVARNLRLLAEYTRDLHKKADRFILGIVSAF